MANPGVDLASVKRLLMTSKKQPVNCAIACGSDASSALILLDRVKSGKALAAELQKNSLQASNVRYGTVSVNPDEDPGLLNFVINRPVSGMARRLMKALQGTGFKRVNLQLEGGAIMESTGSPTSTSTSTAATTTTRIGS